VDLKKYSLVDSLCLKMCESIHFFERMKYILDDVKSLSVKKKVKIVNILVNLFQNLFLII